MSLLPQDSSAAIIRTISHDFKEPLRSVRWYLSKLRESSDMDPQYAEAVIELDDVVRFTQDDFQRFYQDYRERRIALPEFRSFIRTTLKDRMRYLESTWQRLYPSIQGVKFIDPKMQRYPDINVANLNETVKRIIRRYLGLVRYLDVRHEPQRMTLGLHNETVKVIGDLKAIMSAERVHYSVAGNLTGSFDQTLMSLVLQNLIVNSIKYKFEDRVPRIEIHVGQAAMRDVSDFLPAGAAADHLRQTAGALGYIVYSDNGRGIPPAYAELAFQPFVQVNHADASDGSGMGLAIVRSAVEKHDGLIWMTSRLGVGTTFIIVFPIPGSDQDSNLPADLVRLLFARQGGLD